MKISLTLANTLSLLRILIALPAYWSILLGWWVTASLLLIVAILSDIFDGPLARSKNQESSAGGLLDHTCDALFVASMLFALTTTHGIPLLLPILVLTSFMQYVLDSKALSGLKLRTSSLGRFNGIAYFVMVSLCIFSEVLGGVLSEYFLINCAWILVVSTLLSIIERFWTLISKKIIVNKVLVTGANSNLGKKLIEYKRDSHIVGLVRSEKAYLNLTNFIQERNIKKVDVINCNYSNLFEVKQAINSCRYLVHLVGTIKETRINSFDLVHKETTQALIDVIKETKVEKVFYLSILGANKDSTNKCFASRAYSEKLLLDSNIPSLILQIPMVLGEGDYASKVLLKNALSKFNFTFRKISLEQPIYAGDIIQAINNDIKKQLNGKTTPTGIKILAGMEVLTREDLIQKTAETAGVRVKVFSIPLSFGMTLAWVFEKVFADPPITRAMLGVLDHDDNVDPKPTCKQLGIELTPLEEVLKTTMA